MTLWIPGEFAFLNTFRSQVLWQATVIVLLCCVPWEHQLLAQPRADLSDEVDKIIRYELGKSKEDLPDMLVGVIDGDSTFILELGKHADTDLFTLSSEMLFEVGSIAKVFTAGLFCHLAENEGPGLNTPVTELLEAWSGVDNLPDMTLKDVLLHQSGLPKYPSNLGQFEIITHDPYYAYPLNALSYDLSSQKYPSPSGTPLYSHVNYALLEPVYRDLAGTTFQEGFRTFYQESLGIPGLVLLDTARIEMAPGYDMSDKPAHHRRFSSFGPSEGVAISIEGFVKFVRILLSHDSTYPETCFSIRGPSELGKQIEYAGGWFVTNRNNAYPVFVQKGDSAGHSAFLGIVRETGTGVCLLSSSAATTPDLGMLILRLINRNWKRKQ